MSDPGNLAIPTIIVPSYLSTAVPENLKARMKESYDATAPTYSAEYTRLDDPIRLDYLGRLHDQLQLTGSDTGTVLELGCGAGIPATKFLLQSKKPLFRVTGNDLSTTQLDLARDKLADFSDRLTLMQGDMLTLSFPNSSFDVVTAFYSIIHLPRAEQTQLVANIAGWLKPGGYFLANFTEDEKAVELQDTWLNHDKGWMFWSGWGAEKSVAMVQRAGLNVLVKEVRGAIDDAPFVWILARKEGVGGEEKVVDG